MAQIVKFMCKWLFSNSNTRFVCQCERKKKEDNVPLSADKQTRNEIKLGEIVECFYLAYSRYIPKMIIKNS